MTAQQREQTTTSSLAAQQVELAYDGFVVSRDLSVEIPEGKVTSIIGPNGCGKSTLLRAFSRLLAPQKGVVLLDGRDLKEINRKTFAQTVGLLPQSSTAPQGMTVSELVSFGRHPYHGVMGRRDSRDAAAIHLAMEQTGIIDLADRAVDELSGGQRQRVWIAMALAQETDLLLLDEPTTFLDIANQLDILDLVAQLNRDSSTTIAMVLHDMNLAWRYSDHIIAMRDGRVVAQGSPWEVATPDTINDVFGIEAIVSSDPITGTPHIFPTTRAYPTASAHRTLGRFPATGALAAPVSRSVTKHNPEV